MLKHSPSKENLSPRLEKFRREIAHVIPIIPNDRHSAHAYRGKYLSELLLDYVNWRSRFVGVRPRRVLIAESAKLCPAWYSQRAGIERLLNKVKDGVNLTAHLSKKVHTRGASLKAQQHGASAYNKWLDKDFLLTGKGYHHFHIGMGTGSTIRSKEVLFAHVTRDAFEVIAVLDHSVFTLNSEANLWLSAVHAERIHTNFQSNSVVVVSPIATSGHSLRVVNYARTCKALIKNLDINIEDPDFLKNLLMLKSNKRVQSLKFEWHFCHLDLGLYDKRQNVYVSVQKGWN